MTQEEMTAAMEDLARFNSGAWRAGAEAKSTLDPVTMAAIPGIVALGPHAIRAWLQTAPTPEERAERERVLCAYVARSPGTPSPNDVAPEGTNSGTGGAEQ